MAHNIYYHSLEWRLAPYDLTPDSYSKKPEILGQKNPIRFNLENPEMKAIKDFLDRDDKKLEEILDCYDFRMLTEYRQKMDIDYISNFFDFFNFYKEEHEIARNPKYFENIRKELERDKFRITITPEDFRKSENNYIRKILKKFLLKEIPLFFFSRSARYAAVYSFKILKAHFLGDAFEKRQLERLRERIAERQRSDALWWEKYLLEAEAKSGNISLHSLNN